jgi:hypothetical protein
MYFQKYLVAYHGNKMYSETWPSALPMHTSARARAIRTCIKPHEVIFTSHFLIDPVPNAIRTFCHLVSQQGRGRRKEDQRKRHGQNKTMSMYGLQAHPEADFESHGPTWPTRILSPKAFSHLPVLICLPFPLPTPLASTPPTQPPAPPPLHTHTHMCTRAGRRACV